MRFIVLLAAISYAAKDDIDRSHFVSFTCIC